jgi:hypothetical protein
MQAYSIYYMGIIPVLLRNLFSYCTSSGTGQTLIDEKNPRIGLRIAVKFIKHAPKTVAYLQVHPHHGCSSGGDVILT